MVCFFSAAMSRACFTISSAKISFSRVVLPVPGGPFTLLIVSVSYPMERFTAACCMSESAYFVLPGNLPSG